LRLLRKDIARIETRILGAEQQAQAKDSYQYLYG